MNRQDLEAFKALLNDLLKAAMDKSQSSVESMSAETAKLPDLVDQAAVESNLNFMLLMRQRDLLNIQDIREALERIKNVEYGICEECGEDISLARLRVQPTARLCVHCQASLEDERSLVSNRDSGYGMTLAASGF